jgi:branched-chain amino acid transport system ATP-binding protein
MSAEPTGRSDGSETVAGTTHTIDGDAILRIRDLDAGYGDLQILSDVDLDVADGEYVTIVGPNGAGKSTVMKTVFGLTTYMGGMVEFAGEAIHGLSPEQIISKGIGFVPQNDNVFPGLSVRENLEMGAYILDSVPEEQIEAIYDRFPILREREQQKAGTLSGGQQQMVAMGRALMLDPDLLLLDEPSAGLAPDLVADMFDRIDRINDSGTAILMVEQNAKEALRRCDRGYVLVDGENRYTDRGDVLLGDDDVRQDFLGG